MSATFPLTPEVRAILEAALRAAVGDSPDPLPRAARYVLGWQDESGQPFRGGGKRFRPSLCLFVCEALGGSFEDALPAAVALELVHNFSLVHDDIQDRDETRHGRRTLWAIEGVAQAINAGDYLSALGIRTLVNAPGNPSTRVRQAAVLLEAIVGMVEGQWADVSFEARFDVTEAEYLAMTAGKTGAMYAASARLGAIAAAADPNVEHAVARWGLHAGLAFQAQDDYLGIWGSQADTGKPVGSDILRRKKSLPVLVGLADPGAGPIVRFEYGKPASETPGVARVIDALTRAGAGERTRTVAQQLLDEAGNALAAANLPPAAVNVFDGVAAAFVDRSA